MDTKDDKKVGRWVEPGNEVIPFSDMGANRALKKAAKKMVKYIKDPQSLTKLGGKIPKAVLLFGPPGTGKTLVARLIASQAGVPFCALKASELDEQFVGVGAARVRALFEEAKTKGKCIIFIDEIDAMGRSRDGADNGGQGQTLVELLAEIDGFFKNEIYIIAATNKKDVLDDALLSRFEMQIEVGLPDMAGRQEIIAIHTRNKPLDPNDLPHDLAALTIGMAGREIAASTNQASLVADERIEHAIAVLLRQGYDEEAAEGLVATVVTSADFYEGVKVVRFGPRVDGYQRNQLQDVITLVHEAGHFIVTMETGKLGLHPKKVYELSIERRSNALGWCFIFAEEDQVSQTEENLRADLAGLLGGAAFQIVFLGPKSKDTGLSSDLEKATNIARQMVTRWFMNQDLGPVSIRGNEISDETRAKIDAEVRRLLTQAWEEALKIAEKYKYSLFPLFEEALEHGTIHRAKLDTLFEEAFQDANAKVIGSTRKDSWEREFTQKMAEIMHREPKAFSNWQEEEEELRVAPIGQIVITDDGSSKVEKMLADYGERIIGEKKHHQLRFEFQRQETMLQSVGAIVEILEIQFNIDVTATLLSEDAPWHLIIDIMATEGAIRQYLASNTHNVRKLSELIPIVESHHPQEVCEQDNVIDFLIALRDRNHYTSLENKQVLVFEFADKRAMEEAKGSIVQSLEFEYGMRVSRLSSSTSAPWQMEVVVNCGESTIDLFLNSAHPYDVDIAA